MYTTEPLTALVEHLLKEAEEFDKLADRMKSNKAWAKYYLHKAAQYRRWAKDINV